MTNFLVSSFHLSSLPGPLNEVDKPVFGQYAFGGPAGAILRVGDEISVVERST